MALVLVATAGAANANSYATVAEADAYFDAHPQWKIWDALATPDKERNLILATTLIDAVPIDGVKRNTGLTAGVPNQALKFPRGEDVQDSTAYIPVMVKRACFEQALFLSERGGSVSKRRTMQLDGVVSATFGDISETYDRDSAGQAHELSPRAYQIMNEAGFIPHSAGWM